MREGISVLTGVSGSGKTARMLAAYRQVLAQHPPGAALWLAPTQRAANAVREQTLDDTLRGCFSPQCLTFDQFARRVLEASRLRFRPLGLVGQRRLLRGIVQEALAADQLRHFQPIAQTQGFLDLLLGFIQELKRLEIWPQELRAARGAEKDRELFGLYETYQRLLNQHDLYDAQGRFWSARAQLLTEQPRPFTALEHVFVDGFVDFTRTEYEILKVLAGRCKSLTISLPLELDGPRSELFAKPLATLRALERRHAGLVVESCSRPRTEVAALAHAEQYLFANPRAVPAPPEPAGMEVVPAGGGRQEIEQLAQRIKALLIHGDAESGAAAVRPGEVLVVFRSLSDDTADLVRDVFCEYGIPCAVDHAPRLERSPAVQYLAAWLELDVNDWPYRALCALVLHNLLRPAWPEWQQGRAAAAAEYVVRRLQVPVGREALLTQLDRLGKRAERAAADGEAAIDELESQALLARPLLLRIVKSLDSLPTRATPSQWAAAAADLAREAGWLPSQQPDEHSPPAAREDWHCWQALVDALDDLERLTALVGGRPAQLSRREFLDQLRDILRTVAHPVAGDDAGRVRVLAAESARHLSAPYVFLAGLSERSFPAATSDDCLYGEMETRELVAAGLPLVPRAQRRSHEMLLFYQVLTRATRKVVLSYPALDDAAQPLSPSPYVSELERLFAPHRLARTTTPNLSAVPPTDRVYSPRELRVRAAAQALTDDRALLSPLVRHPATHSAALAIADALQVVASRARGDTFGPFEGIVSSDAARAVLAARFGADHCWSPSQLEQYAACPHQFFLERVLQLEALEDPLLAVDYAARGRMLHWMLATLHRRLNAPNGAVAQAAQLIEGQLADIVKELGNELLARAAGDRPLAAGLLEIDVRRTTMTLADYERQQDMYRASFADWDEPPRPAHFEVAFGPRRSGAAADPAEVVDTDDPLSTTRPFELACAGQTIYFSGRIDRIDVGTVGGRPAFAVLDYKSGASRSAQVEAIVDGFALQLPLYALATEQLLSAMQAIPALIAYWHVAGKGCKETITLHEPSRSGPRATKGWNDLRRELPARVWALVSGIREGVFPMVNRDEHCTSRCPFRTVCRVNQARALGKGQPPPGGTP
ncbi:MAG: PD-(D/E)XK nuclease family protein [Pirellulales bacterium]